MPQIVRENIDNVSAVLTLTITKADYEKPLKDELKRIAKTASVKGYRVGSIPTDAVRRMYGQEMLAKIIDEKINTEFDAYFKEHDLNVLGQPMPSVDSPKNSFNAATLHDFVFKFDIGFPPQFELQGLDGSLIMDYYITKPSEDQVEKAFVEMLSRNPDSQVEVETTIEDKDVIKLSVQELDGDKVKEGGIHSTFSLAVDLMPDETKAVFLTKKKGDVLPVNVEALEKDMSWDDVKKHFLGLDKKRIGEVGKDYEATIEQVTRLKIGGISQSFYDAHFGKDVVTNETEAKARLQQDLSLYQEQRSNVGLYSDLQKKLLELNDLEIPETFLKRWLSASNEITAEQVEEEFEAFAQNLRWSLIRSKIAAQLGVQVTQKEIDQYFYNQIMQMFSGKIPEEMVQNLLPRFQENEEQRNKAYESVLARNLLEAMKPQIQLREKVITELEMTRLMGAIEQDSDEA